MVESLEFLPLYYTLPVLVRALVEDEGHGRVPGGFQHLVPQTLLVEAVVPLGEVAGAVAVVCGRPDLPAIYTAATAEPDIADRRKRPGSIHYMQL